MRALPADARVDAPRLFAFDGDESLDEGADYSAEPNVVAHGSVEPEFRPAAKRIPNIGHATLFVSFAGLMLLLSQIVLYVMGKAPAALQDGTIAIRHPKLQLAALAVTYLTTVVAAWLFFPAVWQRGFLSGLRWNGDAARRQAPKLIGLGLLLGALAQVVTYFVSAPKSVPIDDFFQTRTDAWLITIFGTVVAPVFEEVCFRGFLLPAFAIAYDWLSLPRTPEARLHWQTTSSLSPGSLIFSGIFSSFLFALLHAQQVAHVWAVLLAIFSVSLVLTFVRVKTQSVACSAMVHGAYNFFVFLTVMLATGGYRHLDRMTKP